MESNVSLESLSKEQLIARVILLESRLQSLSKGGDKESDKHFIAPTSAADVDKNGNRTGEERVFSLSNSNNTSTTERNVELVSSTANPTDKNDSAGEEPASALTNSNNISTTQLVSSTANPTIKPTFPPKKKAAPRKFDFSKHSKRHILLKIAYLGWNYQGYAVQDDTDRTIEHELFKALLKTCLVESRETTNYHRCGRTDKGVSAFSQVISIDVRSNLKHGKGFVVGPDESSTQPHVGEPITTGAEIYGPVGGRLSPASNNPSISGDVEELNYCAILNRVLPPEIRVTSWRPADVGFSARFDCRRREYRYFFPRGNLDLRRMNRAAQLLVGEHDFRNICKMDVGNGVVNYRRRILSVCIRPIQNDFVSSAGENEKPNSFDNAKTRRNQAIVAFDASTERNSNEHDARRSNAHFVTEREPSPSVTHPNESWNNKDSINCERSNAVTRRCDSYDMCELVVVGQAFLWHQIRCLVAVLMLVGEGREQPEVIAELLDVERNPRKPQYSMASEVPLVLFRCSYNLSTDDEEVGSVCDRVNLTTASSFANNDDSSPMKVAHTTLRFPNSSPENKLSDVSSDGGAHLNDSFWIYDIESLQQVIKVYQAEWTQNAVKAVMVREMLDELERAYLRTAHSGEKRLHTGEKSLNVDLLSSSLNSTDFISERRGCTPVAASSGCANATASEPFPLRFQAESLMQGVKSKVYKPLFSRPLCNSLEQRLATCAKRRKIL